MASVLVYCLPRLYRGANLWLWIYPEPTSNETGKRLAKFLCRLLPSPRPSPTGERDPHKIMPARRTPSPLRERVGVRGNIWL